MPFDEEEQDKVSPHSQKVGLKKINQNSIFDSVTKKPNMDSFNKNVKNAVANASYYQSTMMDLMGKFDALMQDKTLYQNKNPFEKQMEGDLLKELISFAKTVNNDPDELEGEGSNNLIALLFKNSIRQRNKINNLEFSIKELEKKVDVQFLINTISKEIAKALDKQKKSE